MEPVVDQRYVIPSWGDYGFAAIRVVLFVLFLVVLWELINALTKFDDERELFVRKNVGYGILRVSIAFAQAIAMMPLLAINTDASWSDLGSMTAWSAGILVLLLVLSPVVDRVVGSGAAATDLNQATLAASVVKAGFYLALGFILNAALSGTAPNVGTGILSTVVFVVLGLIAVLAAYAALGLFGPLRRSVRQGDESGLAASVVSAGILISLGLVLRTAIAGDFTEWGPALLGFAVTLVTGFIGLVIVVWLIDLLIIRSRRLAEIVAANEVLPAVVMSSLLVAVSLGVSAVVV